MITALFPLLAQLLVPARPVSPVLEFPERGLDDSLAYQQYATRLYRDVAGNTVQIYREGAAGRVVAVWADADDESIAFTARDSAGATIPLRWNRRQATISGRGRRRNLEYGLVSADPVLRVGQFLLGSMRVERDFQYAGGQRAPLGGPAFHAAEVDALIAGIDRLAPWQRRVALESLGADDTAALRARLAPSVALIGHGNAAFVRVTQPSLDARDTLTLELRPTNGEVRRSPTGGEIELRRRGDGALAFSVRISTTARPLTPLARTEIFRPAFLAFLADTRRAAAGQSPDSPASLRARRLERQVRGVELLVSREKLMAGLPTYATYFGRDMLVSLLMMRDIWRPAIAENAIASALRKLGPAGDVSHEEAVGGQAVREAAGEFASLADSASALRDRGDAAAAYSVGARAVSVVRALRRSRENYHMIDDEFQLPVVVARWLADSGTTDARKRAFLLDSTDGGGPRLVRLFRELALVARLTAPYAEHPEVSDLVSFAPRDSGWASASWRDSGAGYAGGRYAMDVNAIWVPHGLEAIERIFAVLSSLGLPPSAAISAAGIAAQEPIAVWSRSPEALRGAIRRWQGASAHFLVSLSADEIRARIASRLDAMPEVERSYWAATMRDAPLPGDSLRFLTLSLDGAGRPIAVANSDPATRLFLGEHEGPAQVADAAERARVLRDVRLFVTPYPVGLLVDGVGPVASNDAYATPAVWRMFERDPYHGPRVVWGREVNLFLLGVANELFRSTAPGSPRGAARSSAAPVAFDAELRSAATRVRRAVAASGFRGELWSYGFAQGRLVPMRYGTAGDVQLWSTTELAVEYALWRLDEEGSRTNGRGATGVSTHP